MANFPWRLTGGALRPDAISGMNPEFQAALQALFAAAPPEVQRELALTSAFRSPEVQAKLWEDALRKYKDPAIARKWVAPPGSSHHGMGDAADLAGFGLGNKLDTVSQATRDWVNQNAAAHGLHFPMKHEPWHIQMMKANAAGGAGGADTTGGAAGNIRGFRGAPAEIGPAMPKSVTDFSPEQRRAAIASIESAGSGDYKALGPWITRRNASGGQAKDRAYGKYQVMGSNIPEWTQQVLGRAMTPDEFVANEKAQDAVFDKIFGDYVRKHGEEGAASMWFTGRPDAVNAKDVLGTSGGQYIQKYMAALTGQTAAGPTITYPDQAGAAAGGGGDAGGGPAPDPDKDKFNPEDLMANLGSMFGGGSGGGGGGGSGSGMGAMRMSAPAMAQPQAPFSSTGAQTPEQAQARLQLALQRLNSRKLV